MVKVFNLNLVFILLYYLHLKVETKAEFIIPDINNIVEFDNKQNDMDEKLPDRYNHVAVDIQRPNPEDVVFPKLRKKKTKKKHNKKISLFLNEISGEDRKKKIKKKNHSKNNNIPGNETDENKKKNYKKKKTRKFIKTWLKDAYNSNESAEMPKLSPVDIIVHIKMNE